MKKLFLISLFFLFVSHAKAQDSLLSLLGDEPQEPDYVIATFKGTRLINFHTAEVPGKHNIEFRVSHRFGNFSNGAYNFFGIDGPVNINVALDYSPDARLHFGVSRSSYQKLIDGFVKYKLLRQREDDRMPVTVTGFAKTNITALKDAEKVTTGVDRYQYFTSRMSYTFQLMIMRKFNQRLSLQLSPTMIHYNLVQYISDKNDIFSIAALGRYKFSNRTALTFEYAYRLNKYTEVDESRYHNSASLGLDIETGGHVFQLMVTNSFGINEAQAIPYTETRWDKGEIRIGFNLSRVFDI